MHWTSCRPISPELNPIERVRKLTRRLCLHNRYFGFLDGVVSAVEEQFSEWTQPNVSSVVYAQLLKTCCLVRSVLGFSDIMSVDAGATSSMWHLLAAVERGLRRIAAIVFRLAPRLAALAFAAILVVVVALSLLAAVEKPFWYDEVCTIIVARQPDFAAIRRALDDAADSNPPVYYWIVRAGRIITSDEHLAYRLPSVLGMAITLGCTYVFLVRRVNPVPALIGVMLLLGTPLAGFALEARPYALMVGCIALSMVAWQRFDGSIRSILLLFASLSLGLSLHFYAVLVWPAFVFAEAAVLAMTRRFRAGVWLAILSGLIPLIVFRRQLEHLRDYYSAGFWMQPTLGQVSQLPRYLFNLDAWGWCFTLGMIAALLLWIVRNVCGSGQAMREQKDAVTFQTAEYVLAVTLLGLPVTAFVFARLTHGGLTGRYVLPAILGGAIAVAHLSHRTRFPAQATLLFVLVASVCVQSYPIYRKWLTGALAERRAVSQELKTLHDMSAFRLPIVISSGVEYLRLAYYSPSNTGDELHTLTDATSAVAYAKTDSVELNLLKLRKYFRLSVHDYREFATRHPEFLLVSHRCPDRFDWWPVKLVHDGHKLTLISAQGETRVYRVALQAATVEAAGIHRQNSAQASSMGTTTGNIDVPLPLLTTTCWQEQCSATRSPRGFAKDYSAAASAENAP